MDRIYSAKIEPRPMVVEMDANKTAILIISAPLVPSIQKEIERKIFPSYVLVKMIMNDESWHVIRNTTGVTGFVGPGSRPVPLSEKEVEHLFRTFCK